MNRLTVLTLTGVLLAGVSGLAQIPYPTKFTESIAVRSDIRDAQVQRLTRLDRSFGVVAVRKRGESVEHIGAPVRRIALAQLRVERALRRLAALQAQHLAVGGAGCPTALT